MLSASPATVFFGEQAQFAAYRRKDYSSKDVLKLPGNPFQVEHIVRVRTGDHSLSVSKTLQQVGWTTWKTYPGCGHEVLYCGDQAFEDIMSYLDR